MRRLLSWALGALAVGTALRATVRPAPIGADEAAADDTDEAKPPVEQRRTWHTMRMVALTVRARMKDHGTTLLAASLAYYAMLSLFPALIATVSIYGMVQEPADVARQIDELTDVLPEAATTIIAEQLDEIVSTSSAGLGVAAAISILGALWAASAGMRAMMAGINRAYDRTESRGFLSLRLVALGLTAGAIAFVVAAFSLATFLPSLLDSAGLDSGGRTIVEWLRWPTLLGAVIVGLGVLYKVAPNRPSREQRLFSAGALVAAGAWIAVTIAFSFYAGNLANLNQTYGAITGVIVLLLWFNLSGTAVLAGAEVNAVVEARRLTASAPSPSTSTRSGSGR